MTSPERAAYEADPWAPPDIAWEELFNEDKEKYRGIAQAVIKASPELAEANATIDGLRELVAEIIGHFSAASVVGGPAKGDAVACVGRAQLAKWHKRAGLAP